MMVMEVYLVEKWIKKWASERAESYMTDIDFAGRLSY